MRLAHSAAGLSRFSRVTFPRASICTLPRLTLPSKLTSTSAEKPGKFSQLARAARASARSLLAAGSSLGESAADQASTTSERYQGFMAALLGYAHGTSQ